MRRRLTNEEKERIDTWFENDVLYKLVADVTRRCSGRMPTLRLSPEEALVFLADLLDRLKEDPTEAPYLCQTAWDTLLYEIREINADASDDDVRKTVAIIVHK